MNRNTFGSEDREIQSAKDGDHINDLINIIDRLDGVISEWRRVTDFDSPEDFTDAKGGIES